MLADDRGEINYLIKVNYSHQPEIYKIYLHATVPHKTKYQMLIKQRESLGLKHFDDPKNLSNSRIMHIIFTKILMNTIQIKTENIDRI